MQIREYQPRKILIRATNWIGDAIMTTPAVRTIRRNFPDAEISILVHPWVADVFSASPYIDRIIPYQKKSVHSGLSGMRRLSRELRRQNFDLAILLQNAFEAALIAKLAGIPLRLGYSRDCRRMLLSHAIGLKKQRKNIHQVHYYQGLLADAGFELGPDELFLKISQENKDSAACFINSGKGPLIGFNPGAAYGPAKRWPAEKYADLAHRAERKYQARIMVFGTDDDRQAAAVIARRCKNIIDLTGRTSLAEAMALIERCRVFVTNDSGLMHVAAALKTPLAAIFGSTNPVTTGPFSKNNIILRQPLPCSPCMETHCRQNNFACMENIEVNDVLTAVGTLLEKK
ncbi:lipopolysaccharide heptosyltransferase II [Desulfobacterota bacterium M19]